MSDERDMDTWIEMATFKDATDEEIKAQIEIFLRRAAEHDRALTDDELAACFELQHKMVTCRALIDGVISGRILVRDEGGRFVYRAAP